MPRTKLTKLNEELNEETAVEKKPVKEKRKFANDDEITCTSVVYGNLFFKGAKSENIYSFADYGDETEIEYRDLAAAVRTKDRAVFDPRFVVKDEDFIEEFPQLKDFYDRQFTVKDIREILALPINEMSDKIKALPAGAMDSLKTIAANQVASGQLDSVKKIRVLDELFGTDLNLLSEIIQDE